MQILSKLHELITHSTLWAPTLIINQLQNLQICFLDKGLSLSYMLSLHVTGVAFIYISHLTIFWMLIACIFMFWAVRFPLSYVRKLKNTGWLHHAHIISVILAVCIPVVPSFVNLKEGFIVTQHPTLVCAGASRVYRYYTFVFPTSIMLSSITCLLIIVCWTIFKVSMCILVDGCKHRN